MLRYFYGFTPYFIYRKNKNAEKTIFFLGTTTVRAHYRYISCFTQLIRYGCGYPTYSVMRWTKTVRVSVSSYSALVPNCKNYAIVSIMYIVIIVSIIRYPYVTLTTSLSAVLYPHCLSLTIGYPLPIYP